MSAFALVVRAVLCAVSTTTLLQSPPQSTTSASVHRTHLTQDELLSSSIEFVAPIYPRAARLAHIEGVVKLDLVIGTDDSIAELRPISGDPVLVDAAMKAVREWHTKYGITHYAGEPPTEIEVPLSYRFTIEEPPKPAFLYLKDGKFIRADEVREFTDGIEYKVGGRIHHIASHSVTRIGNCAVTLLPPPSPESCLPSGEPSFDVRAIPLLPRDKTNPTSHHASP